MKKNSFKPLSGRPVEAICGLVDKLAFFPVMQGKSAVLMSVLALLLALLGWVADPWGGVTGPGWSNTTSQWLWVEVQVEGAPRLLLAYDREPRLSEVLADADLKVWPELSDRGLSTSASITVNGDGSQVRIGPLSGTTALALGQPLDVNRATVADLQLLPGVGPAMARQVVRDRTENGSFSSTEDLTRVKGFGPATVRELKPLVAFD
jgi:competence ComEA-like helix-hairpin-helix protein